VQPLFQFCKALSKKIRIIEKEAKKKKIRATILAGGIQGLWQGYHLAENKPRTTFPAKLSNGELHFTDDLSKRLQERAPDKNFFTLQGVKEAMNNLKDKTCHSFDNIPV